MTKLIENTNSWLRTKMKEPEHPSKSSPRTFFVQAKQKRKPFLDVSTAVSQHNSFGQRLGNIESFRHSAWTETSVESTQLSIAKDETKLSKRFIKLPSSRTSPVDLLQERKLSEALNFDLSRKYANPISRRETYAFSELSESRKNVDIEKDTENAYDFVRKQALLFDSCKDQLLEKYKGKYVLFENGQVMDVGDSRAELAMRAYQKDGMKPLFIEKVISEPEVRAVWTPFTST